MRKDDEPAPAQEDRAGTTESLGAVLRAARLARQLSFEQLSERLRIEPRALIALEEERFEALAAPVFVKGYLKLYAESLGLDSRRLLETYSDRLGSAEPVVRARRSIERDGGRSFPVWVVPALAAVLIGGWWLVRDQAGVAPIGPGAGAPEPSQASGAEPAGTTASPTSAADTLSASASVDALSASASADALSASASADPLSVSASVDPLSASASANPLSASASADPLSTPAPADASSAPPVPAESVPARATVELPPAPAAVSTLAAEGTASPRASPVSLELEGAAAAEIGVQAAVFTPSGRGGAVAPAAAVGAPADAVDPARAMTIALRFVEDSWTEVTDARDARLYYGLGRAGAEARFTAEAPVRVRLGNADGVVLEVDGEVFAYPEGSRRGELATFTLPAAE